MLALALRPALQRWRAFDGALLGIDSAGALASTDPALDRGRLVRLLDQAELGLLEGVAKTKES